MMSRRALLRTGAVTGAGVVLGSCADGADSSPAMGSASTSSRRPPTPLAGSSALPLLPPTSVPPPPPATSARAPRAPWADADFESLDEFLRRTSGRAFMVVERGRTVHEWYRDGDPAFRRDIASTQKSIISLLVGHAVGEGLVAVDTRIADVLGPGWTPAGDSPAVDVGQLLTMTSGLDDRLVVVAPPGTTWRYSNAFAQLAGVLEAITGTSLDALAQTWLFDPAGATTAAFRTRPAQDPSVAPFGLLASAGDLAAIGALVLAGGAPTVTPTWLDASFTTAQDLNPSYGYLWWLNGQASHQLPGRPAPQLGPLIPSAPPDVVAGLGKDDQKLYISRQLELVVVRLGDRADPSANVSLSGFDDDLWTRLLRARG